MDISKIFKSRTRKELFRLYFTNPEGKFYLRELERALDIPVSMIRKELVSLKEQGIFVSEKKGNLAYYSLNKDYPLYNELKSIVFKTVGVRGALTQALQRIEGIKIAFIYGSFARHKEDAGSDIDLFIVGDINENALIGKINQMEKTLKREINYSLYSCNDFEKTKNRKDSFTAEVLKNPKEFLIGEENGLR